MPSVARRGDDAFMNRSGVEGVPGWTFLTNHFLVLLCVARDPDVRVRDIATAVAVTERTTQVILKDLSDAHYLERLRVGRRTHYRVRRDARLPEPLVAQHTVATLLDALDAHGDPANTLPPPPRLVY
jgi:hypothetical protein